MRGLLRGIKVIELAGLAPVPYCGLMLADAGAQVTVIDREQANDLNMEQRMARNKNIVKMNLKASDNLDKVREMCRASDVLIDPYRPGVLEKMGLDPVKLLEDNPGLVVCRLTGYGQFGPMAQEAGHDLNYVAVSGLLPTVSGEDREPLWPSANLLADFGGGGLMAAFGIVTALLNRERNGGQGCIIDNSMVEGLSYLGTFVSQYSDVEMFFQQKYRVFGGKAPIYRTYKTKDGKWMAVGALEPKFNAKLFEVLELDLSMMDCMEDPEAAAKQIAAVFLTKTREEWTKIFEGIDACVTPVLELHESGLHPHNAARGTFKKEGDKWIPEPAPKYYTKEEFEKMKKAKL